MDNDDTVKLLKECNAGIKMGVSSIDDVLGNVSDPALRTILAENKEKHSILGDETHKMLCRFHEEGKEPAIMAKGMSHVKTNVMIAFDGSDHTIADLITDGCNMGVKSLNRYLNKYPAADKEAINIAERLINLETSLAESIKTYL